jgi:hypothetical protein
MITTRTRAFNEQRANISFVRAAIVAGAGIDVRFALVALFGSSSAPISRRSKCAQNPARLSTVAECAGAERAP